MKQVTAYEASNGSLFKTEEGCLKCEEYLADEKAAEAKRAARPWVLRHPIFVALMLTLITVTIYGYYEDHKHKDAPPGWKILCDGKGTYAFQYPESSCVLDGNLKSRQHAINRAWSRSEFELQLQVNALRAKGKPQPPPIQWMDCTGQ